jgi:hypothetical protein
MSREILDRVWSASGVRLIGDGVPAGDVIRRRRLHADKFTQSAQA